MFWMSLWGSGRGLAHYLGPPLFVWGVSKCIEIICYLVRSAYWRFFIDQLIKTLLVVRSAYWGFFIDELIKSLLVVSFSEILCFARNKDIENNITIDLHAQHVREAIQVLKLHLQTLSSVPCKFYVISLWSWICCHSHAKCSFACVQYCSSELTPIYTTESALNMQYLEW